MKLNSLIKRLNPVARYGPCWCLTVFRWGRLKAELCYAPAWYETPEHVHDKSDGEFWIIWARNRYIYRKSTDGDPFIVPYSEWKIGPRDSYTANVPPWKLKTLSVRAGVPHGFKKGDSCMIWICFETWKKGVPVTSVAEDLVLV